MCNQASGHEAFRGIFLHNGKISLKRAEANDRTRGNETHSRKNERTQEQMTKPEITLRILLIEHIEQDRLAFRRALGKSSFCCEIRECARADEALSLIKDRNESFDLVVADIGLPDLSGLDLFRKVKKRDGLPPFVLITSQDSINKIPKALKEGVCDYLLKDSAAYKDLLPVILSNVIRRHKDSLLRQEAEAVLQDAHLTLEQEVLRRTAQLLRTNRRLKFEIEERKRLEEDLRQNEEQFSLFMDHFPGMVYLKDEHGRFLYLNRYIEGIYGIQVNECIGKTASDLWPGEIAQSIHEGDRTVLSTGKDLKTVEEFSARNRQLTFFTQKFPILGNNSPKFIGGISVDITAYRKTEQEKKLLISAIENATESILILDSHGMIQYLNPAAERSLGTTREEPGGKLYEKYASPDGVQEGVLSLKEIGDKPWRGFIKRTRNDGTRRELDIIISPVGDDGGAVTNYTVIEHDVTDEKALQSALERKRRMEALGMLAGGIAHDFINILQPILINAELVADSLPQDAPEREYLYQIMEAARIGKDITNQIKMFGVRKKVLFKPVAIAPVVRDALRIIGQSLPARITLRQTIASTKGLVRTDPPQFYQLLANLCMNAIQSMEEGQGVLTVKLEETQVHTATPASVSILGPGDYLKITVKDTGSGMSSEVMEQIFDPLFTTKKSGKGSGLGLGVVHAVVKNAGGSIIVHSKPRKGSTFEVYLPKHSAEKEEPSQEPAPEILHPGGDRKGRVLLVDDNAIELRSIHHMLVRMGYRVASTNDSIKALDLFMKTPEAFDLLITDQIMPVMNGDEMASRMVDVRKDLPVIICSGSEEALQELQSRQISFFSYLSKPFTSSLLSETVNRALNRECFTFL